MRFTKDSFNVILFLISGPRTRTSRTPHPLFGGPNSFVDDYFTGDIFSAFEEADQYENALLMFYAPWDADCTRAKEILEVVAKTFVDNDIYFAAVNCWEGQCNTEFNTSGGGGGGKPSKNPRLSQHQYPIFIFYPKDRRGIQYNGPISVQVLLITGCPKKFWTFWQKHSKIVKICLYSG